jgi:1,4-alpha-glucan branching enzyme
MLKTTTSKTGTKKQPLVKVTFALSADEIAQPVSVLGDFNNWDPHAHPMKKRSNGTCSAVVEVPAGSAFRFKYLSADGTWFCDPEAEAVVHDEYQVVDSLLVV